MASIAERRWLFPALVFSSLWGLAAPAAAGRVDDALRESRRTGRPVLAVGSSEYCGPCRALHATMESDAQVRALLARYVVLEMDAQSRDFLDLVGRFPADTSAIPMVYVILPDGRPFYAQSGGLSGAALADLLQEAITQSSSGLTSSELAAIEKDLGLARQKAQAGELVEALQLITPTVEGPGDAPVHQRARDYRNRLVGAARSWLQQLDHQMSDPETMHGAAYRIAELYVELPEHEQLHQIAGDLLRRYSIRSDTQTAVAQAKFLLRGRFHEEREAAVEAVQEYREVIRLDGGTPAARYAQQRLVLLLSALTRQLTVQSEAVTKH